MALENSITVIIMTVLGNTRYLHFDLSRSGSNNICDSSIYGSRMASSPLCQCIQTCLAAFARSRDGFSTVRVPLTDGPYKEACG